LEIYHLNALSRRTMLDDLRFARNIYRSNITLQGPTQIEIFVNSVVNSTFQLALNSKVDAVCRGNSHRTPSFKKIDHMKILRYSRDKNETKLRFLVTKAIHQKNLTCHLGNVQKSITIQVLHGPTTVTFVPKVADVVGNGTRLTCLAADGFPIPRITLSFLEGPEDAFKFYKISPCKQKLFLTEQAPIGSRWKFKCSSKNFIQGIGRVYNKYLSFKIGYNVHNNSKQNLTSNYEPKHRNMSGNDDNYLLYEIRRTVSNHSQDINKLKNNYLKLWREISKLIKHENQEKLEISNMKKKY